MMASSSNYKFSFSLIVCFVAVVSICGAVDLIDGAKVVVDNAPPSSSLVDCTTVLISMRDCLSFVTNGSSITKPEGNCCSALKDILKTTPSCLCEGFKTAPVALNLTKAFTLPAACNLEAPPSHTTSCRLTQAPGAAPGSLIPPQTSPPPAVKNESSLVAPPAAAPAPAPAPGKSAGSALLPINSAAAAAAGSLFLFLFALF